MFSLTRQEKLCLIGLCVCLWMGSVLHLCFQKYPQLLSLTEFIEREDIIYKIDVNAASYDDLIQIPYIGAYTAERILQKRDVLGRFSSIQEIQNIPGVYAKNFDKFHIYLEVADE